MAVRGILVVLCVLLAACASEGSTGRGGPSTGPTTEAGEWVVVFASGDPDSLEDESVLIQRRAPGSIAVQPVSCWPGLADELGIAGDAYVAAVTGPGRAEAERAAARVGIEVAYAGPAANACGD